MLTEVDGYTEADASAIFDPQARFVLGCQYGSLVVDTYLGGILAMQIYKYFERKNRDERWTKALVAYVGVMNVVVSVYYWIFTQHLFIQHFGIWLPWLETRWLENMPIFYAMTVCVIQMFFAYRAYIVTGRNRLVFVVCGLLIIASFGGAIGVKILFHNSGSLLGAHETGPALIIWLATATAADVLIAIAILQGLLKHKTGWAHTDKLVSRLIRLTFEAQIPPTFLAIAYLAVWIVQSDSLLGAVFQALQCKAYAVGLLVSLNSRLDAEDKSHTSTIGAQPQVFAMTSRKPTQIHVNVETETHIQAHMERGQQKQDDGYPDFDEDKIVPTAFGSRARLTSPEDRYEV